MNIVLAERLRVTGFVLGCLVVYVGAGLFMASHENRENDRWVAKAEQLERELNARYAEEIRYERGAQRVTFLGGAERSALLDCVKSCSSSMADGGPTAGSATMRVSTVEERALG